jgi:NADPH:quinone reductase-like Zn-dependent oxidoreductase
VVHRQGAPEVLEPTDGPVPAPGPGEVRVAVGAAGVDLAARRTTGKLLVVPGT